ncbi:MAG: PaaI family thioesterase [Caldimicrobium sp.]|nr:PaaI family thioesterase [Caldimicrobium sp.]MCX7873624.1 PaaI family thioesterase [Caldimicrobium sp.]MDW8094428.1 PaaI family thioesterase [Caldimicrobium sp.]
MEIRTHRKIDKSLSGTPLEVSPKKAKVELQTDPRMVADEKGLIHGGFIFSLADYSAMLAVNEETVVLAKAEVKFLKPVVLGDKLLAEAEVKEVEGKKRKVKVEVKRGEEVVFTGEFLCVVPEKHVLD